MTLLNPSRRRGEKKNGAEIYTAGRTEQQKQQNIVIYEFRPNLPC